MQMKRRQHQGIFTILYPELIFQTLVWKFYAHTSSEGFKNQPPILKLPTPLTITRASEELLNIDFGFTIVKESGMKWLFRGIGQWLTM